jgi:hypothetical protein
LLYFVQLSVCVFVRLRSDISSSERKTQQGSRRHQTLENLKIVAGVHLPLDDETLTFKTCPSTGLPKRFHVGAFRWGRGKQVETA